MLNMGLLMEFGTAGKAGAGAQPSSRKGGDEGGVPAGGSAFEGLLSGSGQGAGGDGPRAETGETPLHPAMPSLPDAAILADPPTTVGAANIPATAGLPTGEEASTSLLQESMTTESEAEALPGDGAATRTSGITAVSSPNPDATPAAPDAPATEGAASRVMAPSDHTEAVTDTPEDALAAPEIETDDAVGAAGDVVESDMAMLAYPAAVAPRPAAPPGNAQVDIPGLKPVPLGAEGGRKPIASATPVEAIQFSAPVQDAGRVGADVEAPVANGAVAEIRPVAVPAAAQTAAVKPSAATATPMAAATPVEAEQDVPLGEVGDVGLQAGSANMGSEDPVPVAHRDSKAQGTGQERGASTGISTGTREPTGSAAPAVSLSPADAALQFDATGFEEAQGALQRLGLDLASVAEQSARTARGSASRAARADHQLLGSVGAAMKSASVDETGKTTLKLRPQGLGLIEIELSRDQDNRIHMSMRVQNPMVLDAIQSDRQLISGMLENGGRSLSGFDLSGFDRGSRDDAPERGAPSQGGATAPDTTTGTDVPGAAEAAQSNQPTDPDRVDILI